MTRAGRLVAISDLHVAYPENRDVVERLTPESPDDWLLLAGDVAETFADIEWTLATLRARFGAVIWAPGNHELWTTQRDAVRSRGEERYRQLVEVCRGLDVVTPEDPYPVWSGDGGPVMIAPLFLLYDYTFRPDSVPTKEAALAWAHETGVVCTDEYLLHPDPWPSRDAWCAERVALTERRLADRDPRLPTILVNHFPMIQEHTAILRYPQFAQWCGTKHTADWHLRFDATAVIYGHLHIPRTVWHDGIRFEEVSLGYPREWRRRSRLPGQPRQILPAPQMTGDRM